MHSFTWLYAIQYVVCSYIPLFTTRSRCQCVVLILGDGWVVNHHGLLNSQAKSLMRECKLSTREPLCTSSYQFGSISTWTPRFDWPRTFSLNGNSKASGTGLEASAIVVTLPGVFIPWISRPSELFPRSLKLIHALYSVETLNSPVNLWNLGSTLS